VPNPHPLSRRFVSKTLPRSLPRYRALAATLTEELRAGRHRPGAQLPSVRQLCADHGASLATVTHALHRLEDAGLIEARPRRGFFVRASAVQEVPTAAPPIDAIALAGRRKRLIALATTQADCLSLGHLALDDALLPLAALKRLLIQQLRSGTSVLSTRTCHGTAALREQLALRSRAMGCDFHADDIVVTQGEAEALELGLRVLTRAGDLVAVASPAPFRALEIIASLGLQVLEIPASGDGQGLSVAALAFALQHRRVAACLFEPSCASADGSLMSDAAKQQLAALLAQHQIPLIECDLMGDLFRGTQRPRPVKAFDRSDTVLYCGSFACLTGPGFSLGYVVAGRHHLQLQAARTVHGELLPAPIVHTLTAFMAGGAFELHLRRQRRRLAAQLAAHHEAVLRHFPPGTRVSIGQGGYMLWIELPVGLDACALLEQARHRGYTFVPGAVFTTDARFDHCLRLTASYPLDEARARGIRTLGEIAARMLNDQPARPT